eukprot:TRINITY_DN25587_c0_g1_i1.p1 TRINITY_DN25587_c0_g1~~TRINITY_DN25587_c0_g1_i1.p1  ORF type:complete len:214 (-),score=27.55 TRINITY_DN25587_c0_g1_i1:574-1215(-)
MPAPKVTFAAAEPESVCLSNLWDTPARMQMQTVMEKELPAEEERWKTEFTTHAKTRNLAGLSVCFPKGVTVGVVLAGVNAFFKGLVCWEKVDGTEDVRLQSAGKLMLVKGTVNMRATTLMAHLQAVAKGKAAMGFTGLQSTAMTNAQAALIRQHFRMIVTVTEQEIKEEFDTWVAQQDGTTQLKAYPCWEPYQRGGNFSWSDPGNIDTAGILH